MKVNTIITAIVLFFSKLSAVSFWVSCLLKVVVYPVAFANNVLKRFFCIWRLAVRMIRPLHGRARIRRAPTRPTVVEHRLAEQVDVLALDLHCHRAGGDELGGPVGIGRDQAAARPFAGHIADALEGRAPDRDRVAFDLDGRRVTFGREF